MLLRCERLEPPMSQMGRTRRFRDVCGMSGLPLTADISGPGRHFALGPIAEVLSLLKNVFGL
jgi:hypothetical protein